MRRDRNAPTHGRLRATLAISLVAAIGIGAWYAAREPGPPPIRFTDLRAHTTQFMAYYDDIRLTPEQERVFREALSALPAPCCKDQTAYTCCCQCNMGRTWWGLAKHLVADRDYDAGEVRATVMEWFAFINPDGFSGDACYTGGCPRPFRANGCGGMAPSHLAL